MSVADELERAARDAASSPLLAHWRISLVGDSFWTEYTPPGARHPELGTKIHVSSSIGCAPEVLTRCVAVLAEHGIAFKHVTNLHLLSFQSSGRGGPTQVGKFLTAYPADDATAAEIAALLHTATAGFSGPRIPYETPYTNDSLVYSRHGSFARQWVQLPTGRITPARRTAGGWEADDRTDGATGTEPARVLRGKYVRTHRVFHSPKGSTHLGFVDSRAGGELVVIKEAFAHTMEDLTGRDARSRLRDEARCLATVGSLGIAPRLVEYWDETGSSFLVYEPIPGPTLASVLAELADEGLRPPPELLSSWAESLCAAVAMLHAAGFVSCDIKPSNIVVTPEGLRLIDLELAGPPTAEPTGGMGTPGYCSSQQTDPERGRSTADDVFAIGATMLAMATLTDASALPDPHAVVALEASRDPAAPIHGVVARCLEADPGRRFAHAEAISAALREPPLAVPGYRDTSEPLAMAVEIGDRLLRTAVHSDKQRTYWLSNHSTMSGQPCRDLYAGSGGVALYLCGLAGATDREEYLEAARRGGTWLWETPPVVPRREPMPGLYFGECGPALLYLRLYQACGDEVWLDRAQSIAQGMTGVEIRSPDLITGLAGVGLFQLLLWHATRNEAALDRARTHAAELIRRRAPDRPVWRLPTGFESLSGREYPGFSHGSAGVGYFLAECALASGDAHLRAACQDVADWLVGLAEPALADGSGLRWRAIDGSGTGYGTTWCHGAPGMARFLLRAHAVTGDPAHLAAALRAGRSIASGRQWIGPSQCHGLAGNLEVLIDLARYTGDQEQLVAARRLGENLLAYRTDNGWPSDERSTGCPDLMVGEAGIGAALLRLAEPASPHLISCPS